MRINLYKIKQEEFNKLPQLDRIELRQRIESLERNKIEIDPFSFLNKIITLIGFLILLGFVVMNINLESGVAVINLILPITKVGIIIFVFLFLLEVALEFKHKKKMKDLFSEYFSDKIEVKKKR